MRDLIEYNPATGKLFWKERPREMFKTTRAWSIWNAQYPGKEALTNIGNHGYYCGTMFSKSVLAHRVIMGILHGDISECHIDHINGDKLDNRLVNLRLVSRSQNQRNQKHRSTNTSGYMGVIPVPSGKYAAYLRTSKGKKHLGTFNCPTVAFLARKKAERVHGYHRNHGRAA